MLRSFALPVIQLWALKGAQSPLDENERWAPFETRISIGLCYTMQKQTTFLIQMSNSEAVFLHSQRTLFDHSFFQRISFILSCIMRSNWRVNERRLKDFNGLLVIGLGLNFSWSYITRKDERNFSISVRMKLIFQKMNFSDEKVIDI